MVGARSSELRDEPRQSGSQEEARLSEVQRGARQCKW